MSRSWQFVLLVFGTALCAGGVLVGVIAAIMSPLVFDGPGNLLNPLAWIAFLLVIGLWIVCILAPFGAWVAYIRRRPELSAASMAAPLAWGVVLFGLLQLVPA